MSAAAWRAEAKRGRGGRELVDRTGWSRQRHEEFEERAAMMEFHGGLSRREAELRAGRWPKGER